MPEKVPEEISELLKKNLGESIDVYIEKSNYNRHENVKVFGKGFAITFHGEDYGIEHVSARRCIEAFFSQVAEAKK